MGGVGRRSAGYCEDLGKTLCPPDWAGIADVTQRVAAESSFALAKGNVKGNGILGTPSIDDTGKPVELR